jgi:small nuclear ribonucleoprotein (snRNP)-like protein
MAQQQANKKPQKSLGSFLRHMEGMELIVELKTGRRIRGILESSDDYMNLTLDEAFDETTANRQLDDDDDDDELGKNATALSTATETDSNINILPISSSLHIRGPKIRYIHFPDDVDLNGVVRQGMDRERAAANKYNRGKRKS